jgi:hypothetical protein
MNEQQAALIERLDNPEWIVPGAHLDVPKALADMRAAAECLKSIQVDFDAMSAKIVEASLNRHP